MQHPNFKIWYDAGNIIYYTGKDPIEELKPIAQHVTGFCAKDCGAPRGDVMIQFGTGKVNFAGVFAVLKAAGFDGPIMVECCKVGATAEETMANARANRVFLDERASEVVKSGGGRLWGVSICAPMVIADRRTQTIATSQPAPDGARPRLLGLLNAPIQWGGATWMRVHLGRRGQPAPRRRRELFLHELFHGVQPRLGVGARHWTVNTSTPRMDGIGCGSNGARSPGRCGNPESRGRSPSATRSRSGRPDACCTRAAPIASAASEITEGVASYTGTVLAARHLQPTRSRARSTC